MHSKRGLAGGSAMHTTHEYTSQIEWTGNRGGGTRTYGGYDRTWDVAIPGKPIIHCSNDPLLGGDSTRSNPEDLLLSALAACHMLWYLHYASEAGIVVQTYRDTPVGIGESSRSGAGRFIRAVLRPQILLGGASNLAQAEAIHGRIHAVCFIARSVNFPLAYEPSHMIV